MGILDNPTPPQDTEPVSRGELVNQAGELGPIGEQLVALVPSAGSGSGPDVVQGGNLGATHSETIAAGGEKWLVGTLNANLALTLTLAAGSRLVLLATQDGTGGRTLTVSDGGAPSDVSIPSAAGAPVRVVIESDGDDLYVDVAGGAAPATRTVYTLGPASGSFDIEWADAENADPDAVASPQVVLAGELVFLQGQIYCTGANAVLNFTLPEAIRPSVGEVHQWGWWDNSAGITKTASAFINPDGTVSVGPDDGGAFAADDYLYLTGVYLAA